MKWRLKNLIVQIWNVWHADGTFVPKSLAHFVQTTAMAMSQDQNEFHKYIDMANNIVKLKWSWD